MVTQGQGVFKDFRIPCCMAQYRDIESQKSEAQTYPALLWSSHHYSKFNNTLQQIVSLICIDYIELYVLSPVVICDYSVEISRSMSTPVVQCKRFQSRTFWLWMYSQICDVEIYQFWRDVIK